MIIEIEIPLAEVDTQNSFRSTYLFSTRKILRIHPRKEKLGQFDPNKMDIRMEYQMQAIDKRHRRFRNEKWLQSWPKIQIYVV